MQNQSQDVSSESFSAPESLDSTPPVSVQVTDQNPLPGKVGSSQIPKLEPFITQISIARASDLARAGHYQEAEEVLNAISDGKSHPVVLDLLARMRAQQGRWLEAEAFWKQAIQIDPTNPEYLEGLQFVQRKLKPAKFSRLFSLQTLLWLLAIIGLVILTWGTVRLVKLNNNLTRISNQVQTLKNSMDQPQPTMVLPTQVIEVVPSDEITGLGQQLNENQTENEKILADLLTQITSLSGAQQDIQSSLTGLQPTSVPPLELALNVPGTQVVKKDDQWTIVFDEGLFPYGWALSEQARKILDEISLQLKPYASEIQISITGTASSDEQSTSFDLGLARAVIVLNYLLNTSQLPDDILSIKPQGTLPLPFPNDSAENRLRNRTVTLTIQAEQP
jgi:flagellar motor protein MotB